MRNKIAKALKNITRNDDGTVNKKDYRNVKRLWKRIPKNQRKLSEFLPQ